MLLMFHALMAAQRRTHPARLMTLAAALLLGPIAHADVGTTRIMDATLEPQMCKICKGAHVHGTVHLRTATATHVLAPKGDAVNVLVAPDQSVVAITRGKHLDRRGMFSSSLELVTAHGDTIETREVELGAPVLRDLGFLADGTLVGYVGGLHFVGGYVHIDTHSAAVTAHYRDGGRTAMPAWVTAFERRPSPSPSFRR